MSEGLSHRSIQFQAGFGKGLFSQPFVRPIAIARNAVSTPNGSLQPELSLDHLPGISHIVLPYANLIAYSTIGPNWLHPIKHPPAKVNRQSERRRGAGVLRGSPKRFDFRIFLICSLPCFPQVHVLLQTQPKFRRCIEKPGQAVGHVRTH